MFIILIQFAFAYNTTDYLEGYGDFSDMKQWTLNDTKDMMTVEQITEGNETFLEVKKKGETEINFRNGLYYLFTKSQPEHLRFQFATSQKEIEAANLRLKDSINDKTVISFRCGYAGFIKVNDNQMVTFYNKSVSNSTNIIWTQADILIQWEQKQVLIWINNTYMGSANLYHEDVTGVDQLLIYNLSPETESWWKDIEVCKERCDENFTYSQILIVMIIYILI